MVVRMQTFLFRFIVCIYFALTVSSSELVSEFEYKDNMCPTLEPECSCDKASKIECSNFNSTKQLRFIRKQSKDSYEKNQVSCLAKRLSL